MLQRKCSDLSEIKSLLGSRAALFDRINQDIYEGRVGIWGYGFLGRWLADWLISETGKIPLVFDSNFNNGKLSSQHSIRNPKTINTSCTGILISARHNVKPIGVMMEATGVPYMSADEFFLHKLFFDYERVFHLFEDDKSRATLRAILNSLIRVEDGFKLLLLASAL